MVNNTVAEKQRTGLVTSTMMADHECLWDKDFIENPRRLTKPLKRCTELNLINRCYRIEPRMATEEELGLIHENKHIEKMKSSTAMSLEELRKLSTEYDSVYFNNETYNCALLSAGCTLNLVSSILTDQVQNGMAIIRPPGHHAMTSEACGFCFFNNAALAAKFALERYNLERILVVDWDIHHGQATQQAFYHDKRVLYFSIHRYEHGSFWPELRESNYDFIGEGAGRGYNFNVPLNKTGMKNADYLAIWYNILLPVAYEFNPQLVVVSAGFDSAYGCPEGEMQVSPQAYSHLLHPLLGLAQGHVCVLLEGGYCIPSLQESVAITLKTLLGDPCIPIGHQDQPCLSLADSILDLSAAQRSNWKSLRFQPLASLQDAPENAHVPSLYYHGTMTYHKADHYSGYDYPVQNLGIRRSHKLHLAEMIRSAKMDVPPHSTAYLEENKMAPLHGYYWVEADNFKAKLQALPTDAEVPFKVKDLINHVLQGKSKNGLCEVENFKFPKVELGNSGMLFIDFNLYDAYPPSSLNEDRQNLHVAFTRNSIEKLNADQRSSLVVSFDKQVVKDEDFLSSLFHLLLPIGYKFNPALVLVYLSGRHFKNKKDLQVSDSLFGHLLHLLQALANGKLVVVVEDPNEESFAKQFAGCIAALTGAPLHPLPTVAPDSKTIKAIQDNVKYYAPVWPCLSLNKPIVADIWEVGAKEGDSHFHAKPRIELTCSHLAEAPPTLELMTDTLVCCQQSCPIKRDLSICLTCNKLFCSKRKLYHSKDHWQVTQHCLFLRLYDLSSFCFQCQVYLEPPEWSSYKHHLQTQLKFKLK